MERENLKNGLSSSPTPYSARGATTNRELIQEQSNNQHKNTLVAFANELLKKYDDERFKTIFERFDRFQCLRKIKRKSASQQSARPRADIHKSAKTEIATSSNHFLIICS